MMNDEYKRMLVSLLRHVSRYKVKAVAEGIQADKAEQYNKFAEDFQAAYELLKNGGNEGEAAQDDSGQAYDNSHRSEAAIMAEYIGAAVRVPKNSYHFPNQDKVYIINGYSVQLLEEGGVIYQVLLGEEGSLLKGGTWINFDEVELVAAE